MQRELISFGYQSAQLQAQIDYMQSISGENADARREEMYIFDWSYSEMDFSSADLSRQEIYLKAEIQLRAKAQAYITALRNCNVKARRMKGIELMEEIRRYTHPHSANKEKAEDILKSAYDSICVTSNSLRAMEEDVNHKIINEILEEIPEGIGHE